MSSGAPIREFARPVRPPLAPEHEGMNDLVYLLVVLASFALLTLLAAALTRNADTGGEER